MTATETAWLKPTSLEDALSARAQHPDYLLLSGGTDVMVGVLHRDPVPGVIDLFGLDGLVGIEADATRVRIGAGTTYAALLRSDEIRMLLPALHECVREIGAVQIQERGTLGGNMATSSPVGDTLPVLLALDAVVELASSEGARRVPYAEFCTGYRTTVMKPDELIAAIEIPTPHADLVQYWRKVGTRKAQAISKVMLAGAARLEDGTIVHARLGIGAVADRPIRLTQAEQVMEGQAPSAALAEQVSAAVRSAITPITDVRSTEEYRLEVACRLAARFVLRLAEGAE